MPGIHFRFAQKKEFVFFSCVINNNNKFFFFGNFVHLQHTHLISSFHNEFYFRFFVLFFRSFFRFSLSLWSNHFHDSIHFGGWYMNNLIHNHIFYSYIIIIYFHSKYYLEKRKNLPFFPLSIQFNSNKKKISKKQDLRTFENYFHSTRVPCVSHNLSNFKLFFFQFQFQFENFFFSLAIQK